MLLKNISNCWFEYHPKNELEAPTIDQIKQGDFSFCTRSHGSIPCRIRDPKVWVGIEIPADCCRLKGEQSNLNEQLCSFHQSTRCVVSVFRLWFISNRFLIVHPIFGFRSSIEFSMVDRGMIDQGFQVKTRWAIILFMTSFFVLNCEFMDSLIEQIAQRHDHRVLVPNKSSVAPVYDSETLYLSL